MIFLSAGLKYQDVIVSAKSNTAGNTSVVFESDAIWEQMAPVVVKKNPAYAHSFNNGVLGISTTIVPNSFHVPKIVRKYIGYPRSKIYCTSFSICATCTMPVDVIPSASQMVAIQ